MQASVSNIYRVHCYIHLKSNSRPDNPIEVVQITNPSDPKKCQGARINKEPSIENRKYLSSGSIAMQ
jgi:hypothetical protein